MDDNIAITKVLYIDDDLIMLENFKFLFKNYFEIIITDCVNEARKIIEEDEIK